MTTLQQYSDKQGKKPTGQFASKRFILDDQQAKKIFLKVAKDAQEKYISDTVAAQYLVDTYKEFKHLNYNTVRRYFKDYRDGRIK
tara:strand:- start:1794 stop:2048 length:255 start_codon:yes stop_codon:yes gene_type:complete